ncbi:amino acid ABC transporter permease [Paenibacillus sp. MSJ-34]|uniref:amino acid ABC transporter permease n=1 Tax=Paenibacillus sp. MSJ-34 TaxID=2841529 RepID=UPI001C1021FA|nr:amino acid ABC transporter permease [Paenibacillus sp. MSJ-34]MBU5443199.1 amino acid ABC transporter permease [Paenibacillus sp. MSJ-34]
MNIISFFAEYKQYFITGAAMTLWLSLLTVIFGFLLGTVLVLMRLSGVKPLRWIAVAYVEFLRGTPLMVQLFIIYFGLTSFGIELPKFTSGVIALSMNSAAYLAEILRAGIQGVDKGQTEAARSLGMSHAMTMRYIVFPQALRNVLPAIGNEFIVVIKESSIVSLIGVSDIMYNAEIVRGSTFEGMKPLVLAAILYFILTFTLSKLFGVAERRHQANA